MSYYLQSTFSAYLKEPNLSLSCKSFIIVFVLLYSVSSQHYFAWMYRTLVWTKLYHVYDDATCGSRYSYHSEKNWDSCILVFSCQIYFCILSHVFLSIILIYFAMKWFVDLQLMGMSILTLMCLIIHYLWEERKQNRWIQKHDY